MDAVASKVVSCDANKHTQTHTHNIYACTHMHTSAYRCIQMHTDAYMHTEIGTNADTDMQILEEIS